VNIEKKILEGCIKGNGDCQKALYNVMAGKMYALCLRYARDNDDAKDILQEGFIKVYTKIDQYGFKGSFEGWMRRIFVNTALMRYRDNKMIHVELNEQVYEDEVLSEELETSHGEDELLKLIDELSPRYKLVFNLYAIEGYSHQEISKMLNISEGTSKSNLSRARTILQEKLRVLQGEKIKLGENI
jgi:RNA polymerase sigma-70 factor (ECF subfamily)